MKLMMITVVACMVAVQALAGIGSAVVGKAMADSSVPGPADLVGLGVFGAGVAAMTWEVRKVKIVCL